MHENTAKAPLTHSVTIAVNLTRCEVSSRWGWPWEPQGRNQPV